VAPSGAKSIKARVRELVEKIKAYLMTNAKMLGVWSGVIALIAWVLSNTLLEYAKASESALDKVREERNAFRQARTSAGEMGNIRKQLTRIENRLPLDEVKRTQEKRDLIKALDDAAFISIAQSDASQLVYDVRRGIQIANKVNDRFEGSLQAILKQAEDYSKQVDQIKSRFEKEVTEGRKGISIETISDEEAAKKTEKCWNLEGELRKYSNSYSTISEQFNDVFNSVESDAERATVWRKWLTRILNVVALLFVFVGLALGVLGKYYEAREKQVGSGDGSSLSSSSSDRGQAEIGGGKIVAFRAEPPAREDRPSP
jgi:hypothetical protein